MSSSTGKDDRWKANTINGGCIREARAISEAAVAITSELDLDKVLQTIVDSARDLLNARFAALGVVDEDQRRLTAFIVSGVSRRKIATMGPWPRGLGLLGLLLRDPTPVRIKRISQDPRSIGFPPNHPLMTSFIGVPIMFRGRILGNFYITEKIGQEEFSQGDQDLLVMFASQAAVAIENARLHTEKSVALQQKIRQLEASVRQNRFLAELGLLLQVSPLTEELPLEQLAERLTEVLGDACGLVLVEENGPSTIRSHLMFHANPDRRRAAWEVVEAAWPWLTELVIANRQAIIITLADSGEPAPGVVRIPVEKPQYFTGIIAVPLASRSKCYGILVSLCSQPLEFTKDDLRIASLAADRLAIAIENYSLFSEGVARATRLAETERTAHIGSFETEYLGEKAIWSEETYHIFGLDPTEKAPSASEYLKHVHPDDRGWLLARIRQASEMRTQFTADYRIVTPGGAVRWVYVVAKPVDHRAGPTRFFGTIMDITERKNMEEALRKARDDLELRITERTAELQEANERLRTINQELILTTSRAQDEAEKAARRASELEATIENIADAVFICDKNGRIVDVNRAGHRLIGLGEKAGALGPLTDYLGALNIRDARGRSLATEELAIRRALRGEVVVACEEIGKDLQRKRDAYLLVSAAPILDREGKMTGAVEVISDITRIRELDKLKDEFIAVAAHELKTPIAIMKGNAQALLRTADTLSLRRRERLEAIDRGADRIDRIVRDLLDISRLYLGRLELVIDPIDLSKLVQEAVQRMAKSTAKHYFKVVSPESIVIKGDRQRLEQVLANLIDNAIKYSPEGGDINLTVAKRDKEAIVSVEDTGIGIPNEKQAYIFERFYRAHTGTPYDYGGIGVGLYISREIVLRHGGHMWFESEEGKGSVFYFSLPIKP